MATPAITIRSEQPVDVAAIRRVHGAAFPTPAEGRLVDLLREAGRLDISLVAVRGDAASGREEIVGHIALSPVTVAGRAVGLGLGPIGVLPAEQGRGIGGQLIQHGLAACHAANVGLVVVLGEPAYYSRFGFAPARTWNLQDEYQGGNTFQAIELAAGAIPLDGGLVQYAPEFAIFG